MNAHTLIGQSAMVYCAGKPMKIWHLLNYYIKSIDHKFSWLRIRNHSPAARDLQILLTFFQHPMWFISL